jgi:ArsR family transcriptional regulator
MTLTPIRLFQTLSDSTRLRSLLLLARENELCVCELTHALDVIQPKISRHLALLRDADIVCDRRQGQWIYYRLNPALPDWARDIIDATVSGAEGQQAYINDRQALKDMPNRPGTACCA